jgi:hypothetical protein
MRTTIWKLAQVQWAALLLGAVPLAGQTCPVCDQGPQAGCQAAWTAAATETVTGSVLSVDRVTSDRGWEGVHMVMQTPDGPLTAHLGPAWYLDNQDEMFAEGDEITVTGRRAVPGRDDTLIAMEVKKGDAVLTLRQVDGYPAWQGWRGGHHRGHHHACPGAGCRSSRPPR